jgi:hypothetical protein
MLHFEGCTAHGNPTKGRRNLRQATGFIMLRNRDSLFAGSKNARQIVIRAGKLSRPERLP